MADRRSIADALSLTPDKVDFIRGERKPAVKPSAPAPQLADQPPAEVGEGTETRQSPIRRARRVREIQPDQGTTLLPDLLVPLTTRLQPDTAHALRRAYLEQKLRGQKPVTQQEIVEEALSDWLRRHSYV